MKRLFVGIVLLSTLLAGCVSPRTNVYKYRDGEYTLVGYVEQNTRGFAFFFDGNDVFIVDTRKASVYDELIAPFIGTTVSAVSIPTQEIK